MKFSIKDWFFLFISFALAGIGLFHPVHPWVEHALIIVGIFGILFVLGFNVYRTRSKPQRRLGVTIGTEKDSDYFPRLNKKILKEFAKRVVNKYRNLPILKITLYRYHSKYFSNVNAKYAMIFEIDPSIKQSSELMDLFHDLQVATGWLGTVPDTDSSHYFGIDASFSDVYIENPSDDFLKEWNSYAKTSDENMQLGIMINEKNLLLFDSTT